MILHDRCSTPYTFSWQVQYFRQIQWKNHKTQSATVTTLALTRSIPNPQNCPVLVASASPELRLRRGGNARRQGGGEGRPWSCIAGRGSRSVLAVREVREALQQRPGEGLARSGFAGSKFHAAAIVFQEVQPALQHHKVRGFQFSYGSTWMGSNVYRSETQHSHDTGPSICHSCWCRRKASGHSTGSKQWL